MMALPRFFSGLHFRLLLLIFLTVLPAVGLNVYMGLEERRLMAEALAAETGRLTHIVAMEETQLINATRQLLVVLAHLPELRQQDATRCSALLKDLLSRYQRYANLAAATPQGEVFCSALPWQVPVNVADLRHFERAFQTRDFAIGDYQIGRISGKPSINFGYPILDEAAQLQGVVYAAVDLNWLNQLGTEVMLQLPPDSTFIKLDTQGKVLVRLPDSRLWVGQDLPETALREMVLTQDQGTLEMVGADGHQRVYAFSALRSPLYGGEEYVILGLSSNAIFGGVNQLLFRSLTGLALVAGLTAVLAWVGSSVFILRPVQALIRTAQQLATGDLSARTGLAYRNGELWQLAQVFDEMASALEHQTAQQQLANQELRHLTARLAETQEMERKHLARELHDQIGQNLTLLGVNLNIVKLLLTEAAASPVRTRLEDALVLVEQTTERIRDVMSELRPAVLDDYGLNAALHWYARLFSQRTGIPAVVVGAEAQPRLPAAVETALFRITQEALTNVARHAWAQQVTLTLHTEASTVSLRIADDGQGFVPVPHRTSGTSWGLVNMRERAEAVGGTLEVDSAPGHGTRLTIQIPR